MNATEANQLSLFVEPAPEEVYEGSPESYGPGHPWYYLLGGRQLEPTEIEPARRVLSLDRLPKQHDKRRAALLSLRTDTAADLQRDIERYAEIRSRGLEALSRFDRMMCEDSPRLGVAEALSLKHNHISFNRGRLAEIDQELEGLSELFPLTGELKGEGE
jgi:hypothetical protein